MGRCWSGRCSDLSHDVVDIDGWSGCAVSATPLPVSLPGRRVDWMGLWSGVGLCAGHLVRHSTGDADRRPTDTRHHTRDTVSGPHDARRGRKETQGRGLRAEGKEWGGGKGRKGSRL